MRDRQTCWIGMLWLACLGCGTEPVALLACRVSHDGQPQAGAEVLFEATGEKSAAVLGASLPDGTCFFDYGGRPGLPPGDYRITVMQFETADGKPLPAGEEGQALKAEGKAVRKRYAFQRTLAEGENAIELKLEEGEPVVESEEVE